MESGLEWLNEEEGILTVSEQGNECMSFRVFALTEEEAELKPENAEIVETTAKSDGICKEIIFKMTNCIKEAFLQMWNEGFEETCLVVQKETRFAKLLDSISVVQYTYSEYMMKRVFKEKTNSAYISDNLNLQKTEEELVCESKDGAFFCRLLPYEEDEINGRVFYLYEVEVAKEKRNQGIATACLSELFLRLSKEGAVTIYLQVGSYNEPAVHLYKKLGFVISEELCYYTVEEE